MEIILEQEAVNRLQDAIASLDLDGLAKLVSEVTNTSRVIVVHDDSDNMVAADLRGDIDEVLGVITHDFPCGYSDVYENGKTVGYVDRDGTLQEFGNRYEAQMAIGDADYGTMQSHVENRDLLPIYDQTTNKIVGYAVKGEEDTILKALNG